MNSPLSQVPPMDRKGDEEAVNSPRSQVPPVDSKSDEHVTMTLRVQQ